MHPLKHPWYAIAIGVIFIVIAVIYYAVPAITGGHLDWAGFTMLIALGVAMGLMSYVLIAGSPND